MEQTSGEFVSHGAKLVAFKARLMGYALINSDVRKRALQAHGVQKGVKRWRLVGQQRLGGR
jgi:hypothetical protein